MAPYSIISVVLALLCCVSCRNSLQRDDEALPKGCWWTGAILEISQEKRSDELQCKIKTITRTESLLANISSYQIDRIKSLKLECNDVMFFESSLESTTSPGNYLGHLSNLVKLSIEYCKIKYIPALVLSTLKELKSLTLRTRNVDWPVMNLELHPLCFRGLKLKELNLAENNIWSLPAEVFCPLTTLQVLNITGNRLNDISQLGLSDWGKGPIAPGKACNTGLEVLDVSKNDVTMLPDNGLSALRSLNALYLQGNSLSEIADRALVGLGTLEILNLSNNKLIALPPEMFQSSRKIRQIYLQNNTLSVLAPGLLEGLDRLETLDLSRNELSSTWIKRDTLAGQIRLVVLNLGHNLLSKIDHHVFKGLYSLQILNIEHNAIETIADGAFSDLKNLHALFISHNKLKRIEAFHFSELYVLNQLILESNEIDFIHERAFENLTRLHDLSLNDNKLDEIPAGMRSLRFLQSLDLGKNKITIINNSSFEGLEELMGLRLVDNMITEISRDTFYALSSIHVLNLASNKIKHVDQSAFSSNPTIRAIRLDNNELEDVSGVFTSLLSLVWLNVSDNNIGWFDYSHFSQSLEWLDIHKNNISELGNYYDVGNSNQLKMLDISYNRITSINANSFPHNIETLFLNNNLIEEIRPETFTNKENIEKVVLYGNNIRHFAISSLTLSPVPETRDMPQFYIGDNLIHCDCNMEWLQRINDLSYLRQYPKVMDLDTVMCTMEHERGEQIRPLIDVKPHEFLCQYESHCLALCHCCDYDSCDCKMTCPDRCSCFHDPAWNTNVIDCGSAGLTIVPGKIPMDATDLYLDGNHLGELGSHVFVGKKKLQSLYLNNSHTDSLNNKTFIGLPALRILHLENNGLEKITGAEFEQLKNLKELYLDHNSIRSVGDKSFYYQNFLEVLTINDNVIDDFKPWEQLPSTADTFKLISLSGNKLNCACDSINKLMNWIEKQFNDTGISDFMCSNNKLLNQVIKDCENNKNIPVATPTVQRTIIDTDFIDYLPLLIAVIAGLVLTILIVTLVFIFRNDFYLWAHAKYGVRLCKDPITTIEKCEDNEKLYDGYFIYSSEDADLVSSQITLELEHTGYGLCLHYRDIHSAAFLADSLQSAADASRKLVLFISVNFLQLEWSQPEFRSALQSVLELIRPSRRKQKIILITSVPNSMMTMDPIMEILIRTCTVITWDDRKFWDKLRFAMPDTSKNVVQNKNIPRKSINLRYTPAPTNVTATWPKRLNSEICVQIPPRLSPTHSTYNTEDEMSTASSPQYEAPSQSYHHHHNHNHNHLPPQHHHLPPNYYRSKSNTNTLGHVYSTIPEAQYNTHRNDNNRPYFV